MSSWRRRTSVRRWDGVFGNGHIRRPVAGSGGAPGPGARHVRKAVKGGPAGSRTGAFQLKRLFAMPILVPSTARPHLGHHGRPSPAPPHRPGGPLPHRAPARRGRHGHGLPGRGPEARPQGGDQGPEARAGGGPGRRPLPGRDQDHRLASAPQHPPPVRLGHRGRLPLLRHALRRGGIAPRPAEPGEAASRAGGRGPHLRSGGRSAVRARARGRAPRHQAGEHPPPRRPSDGGGLRDRAGGLSGGGRPHDGDGAVARHAALHESRAGDGRARHHGAQRRLLAGQRAVRDADRATRRTWAPRRSRSS